MSERTPSLLPRTRIAKDPQEIRPQNSHFLTENFTSVEKIGQKTTGVLLITTGIFMVIWGTNKAIEGATGSGLGDFIVGAAVAYFGWKIAGKGFELIKK